jgi:hypothetical protein
MRKLYKYGVIALLLTVWVFVYYGGYEGKRVGSRYHFPRPRVLVTDYLFPNALAKWRLVEIGAFIERYDTDIFVPYHAPGNYSLDWDALRESHHLARYEVLIFDSAFNSLDIYNKIDRGGSGLHGAAFNNLYPGAYLLRLRKFSGTHFNVSAYAAVYHIFLWQYHVFNLRYGDVPQMRQMIHLYPGGAFVASNGKFGNPIISDSAALVVTQAFTASFVRMHYPNNTMVSALGGPFLFKGERPLPKPPKARGTPLIVAFASLGNIKEKGADHFVDFAEAFRTRHPHDNVIFWGIGNVPASIAVQALPIMPQAALDKLYAEHVDVYITCENTDRKHGWPLGLEAVLRGAVLFAVDDHNYNDQNQFFFTEGFTRLGNRSTDNSAALQRLHRYSEDFDELHRHSLAIQQRSVDLFSFTRQMQPIFTQLEARMKAQSG